MARGTGKNKWALFLLVLAGIMNKLRFGKTGDTKFGNSCFDLWSHNSIYRGKHPWNHYCRNRISFYLTNFLIKKGNSFFAL